MKAKMDVKRAFKSPYMFIFPTLLYYASFWLIPVFIAIVMSITNDDGGLTLQYFKSTFTDPLFKQALINTLIFAFFSVIIQYILALGLALLLNRKFFGSKIMFFIMLIPMAIPPAAVAILWGTGFQETGWVNSFFDITGIQYLIEWMGISDSNILWTSVDGNRAIFLLIVIDTWTVLPSVMIILLAGLQGFNEEYKEAAYIFGATKRQALRDIVIPIMKPTIITSILLRLIAALQVWLIAVLMFGFGRVPFLVERLVYFASNRGEVSSADKYATTYSIIVVVLVMLVSISYLKISNRNRRKV